MERTMEIRGMMCGHCEAAVKKALEAVPGVAEAKVSHETGTAVVTLTAAVDDAALKKPWRTEITRSRRSAETVCETMQKGGDGKHVRRDPRRHDRLGVRVP